MEANTCHSAIPADAGGPAGRLGKIFVVTVLVLLIMRMAGMAAWRGAMSSYEAWNGGDFGYFYRAAVNVREGRGIYLADSQYGYVYTPLVAIAMQPLARLPMRTAFKIWTAGEILCIVGAAGLCAGALASLRDVGVRLPLMIIMGFRFWPTDLNFVDGQTNFVLLLLLSAIILAATRRRVYAAALLIALAALCKTWMLGLMLYLLIGKSWRAALVCVTAFAAGVALLFTVVGWGQFHDFLQANRTITAQTGMMAYSIPGFAKAYFRSNHFIQPLLNNSAVYYGFLALAYGLLLSGLTYIARLRPARTWHDTSLRVGVVTLSLLLVLPVCHPTYMVLCLPLLWTLVTAPLEAAGRGRMAGAVGAVVIYFALTFCLPVFTLIPAGYHAGWRSLLLSGYFYATAMLWALALGGVWLEHCGRSFTADSSL